MRGTSEEEQMASLTLEGHSGLPSDEFVGKVFSLSSVEPKMARRQYSRGEIAREQGAALSQLDKLLDPQNTAVSLVTLARAAALSGKRLVVEIRDQHPVKIIETKKKGSLPLG
jgi:hypothetical protein